MSTVYQRCRGLAMSGKTVCGARKRQSEGICTLAAGWGTSHPGTGRCKLHGGSTRNHRVSAARQATEAEARDLLERLGEPQPLGDPIEELLRVGAEVLAYQDVLRERLAELREFSKDDVALIDRERAVVKLYGEALDRSHRVLSDLARLGLDERLVRVREAQALAIVTAVVKVLATPALALEPAKQHLARSLLSAELAPATGVAKRDQAVTTSAKPQVTPLSIATQATPNRLPISSERTPK
ncbi:MAG: hypothetical protein ACRDVW_05550 [Acidimicrobiales bacterium]